MALQQIQARAAKLVLSIQSDLEQLESGQDTSTGIQGRISASLGSLERSIKDMQDLISREMDAERRQDGKQRVQKLKDDHQNLRVGLDRWRQREQQQQQQRDRDALLATPTSAMRDAPATIMTMEDHVVRQDTSIQRSIHQVDEYLRMGQESLGRLREQGMSLKTAQRRMLDVANTLGLSQTTIRWIERRTTEDKYVFWGGVALTLTVMYFAIRYWT